jgi:hypothetical protein
MSGAAQSPRPAGQSRSPWATLSWPRGIRDGDLGWPVGGGREGGVRRGTAEILERGILGRVCKIKRTGFSGDLVSKPLITISNL